ncbi:37748_t:CDS:2, partial [Gigaspora margarita]
TFEACAITDEENEYNIHSKEAENQLNIENDTSNTIDTTQNHNGNTESLNFDYLSHVYFPRCAGESQQSVNTP